MAIVTRTLDDLPPIDEEHPVYIPLVYVIICFWKYKMHRWCKLNF